MHTSTGGLEYFFLRYWTDYRFKTWTAIYSINKFLDKKIFLIPGIGWVLSFVNVTQNREQNTLTKAWLRLLKRLSLWMKITEESHAAGFIGVRLFGPCNSGYKILAFTEAVAHYPVQNAELQTVGKSYFRKISQFWYLLKLLIKKFKLAASLYIKKIKSCEYFSIDTNRRRSSQ